MIADAPGDLHIRRNLRENCLWVHGPSRRERRGRRPARYGAAHRREEDGMGFRVVVDFDRCESNALCMGVAPEVFEVRDDDFLYLLQEQPPAELRERCEEAARICPKQAITLVDE